jgi:hypothetical protein
MATDLYARFNGQTTEQNRDVSLAGMRSDRPVTTHGVSFNEIAKLGALMYAACLRLFGRGLLQDVFRLLSASGKAELQQVSTAFQSAKANHD